MNPSCELCDDTGEMAVRGMDGERYEMVPCHCQRQAVDSDCEADPLTGPRMLTSAFVCGVITLVILIVIVRLI